MFQLGKDYKAIFQDLGNDTSYKARNSTIWINCRKVWFWLHLIQQRSFILNSIILQEILYNAKRLPIQKVFVTQITTDTNARAKSAISPISLVAAEKGHFLLGGVQIPLESAIYWKELRWLIHHWKFISIIITVVHRNRVLLRLFSKGIYDCLIILVFEKDQNLLSDLCCT